MPTAMFGQYLARLRANSAVEAARRPSLGTLGTALNAPSGPAQRHIATRCRRRTPIHMPEEKIFNAKPVNLNYLDWGPSSADPLVMLHGGAWSWQEYLSSSRAWPKTGVSMRWISEEMAGRDGSPTPIVCRISSKTAPVPRPTEGPNGAGRAFARRRRGSDPRCPVPGQA